MIDKLFTDKALMSFIQISILIVASFAFGYLVSDVYDQEENYNQEEEFDYNSLLGRTNFKDLFDVPILGGVDAQTTGCCELTKSGNTCQTTSLDECDENHQSSPTSCEFTGFCELGCCISPENGLCNERTSKLDCENSGGTFKNDEACNVQECRQGCCVIGGETLWTTDKNCQWEGNSQNQDLPTDWRTDVASELQCLFLSDSNNEGACVDDSSGERRCTLTSLDECFRITGSENSFYKDSFCSNPELNTTCEAKDHKECVSGEEDVYWFDSCGNQEDVAHDCNFYGGTYCGAEGGEFVCRDIDCDTNGDGVSDRKNGESWCSYDAAIGNGKDTVGSRHVKHICHMGVERIAACSDLRNEICVQEDTNLDGGRFSEAACRVNQWRTCLDLNSDSGPNTAKCNDNPDCKIKNIDMDGSFSFSVCVPNYPGGFDLIETTVDDDGNPIASSRSSSSSTSSDGGTCDIATQKCTEIWECGLIGGCKCKDNCDCHTARFTQEMNDLCISLGDCGAYINYIGEFTGQGYTVIGAPRLDAGGFGYSQYKNKPKNPAPPGNDTFFKNENPEQFPELIDIESNLSAFQRELLESAGAFGSPLLLAILKQNADNETEINFGGLTQSRVSLGRFTGGLGSAKESIAAQVGDGKDKKKKDISAIAAAAAGFIVQMITNSILFSIIAALIVFLILYKKIKKKHIYFTCLPWEPPAGGDKCNECNNLDVPCTEYRCESLGQLCHLINRGTGNELCVSKPENNKLPVITPFESAISEGYKYSEVTPNSFKVVNETNEGCIEPYTPIDVGIKVDPFAKCRVGVDGPDKTYEEMPDSFGLQGNNILPAHVMRIFVPSPEAFKNFYNLTEEQIEEMGKLDYYVRCRTANGKVNPTAFHIDTCINPGPDLTAPRITLTEPESGSYSKFGATEEEVTIYVNEPSTCKWSSENKEFEDMEGEFMCEIDPLEYGLFGLPCTTTITGINETDKFYFKCRDLSENTNTMTESVVWEINPSEGELVIDEIIPREGQVITSGVEPVSTEFRLSTSGGVNDKAMCSWEGNGFGDSFIYSKEDGSSVHEYTTTSLVSGRYNINFMCEDIAGNVAERATSFDIKIDKLGPRITRVYFDDGLKIVTNENAECRYDFRRDFLFENATKMSSEGVEHFGDWVFRTQYVQCKDEFGNKGVRLRIRPY